MPKISVLFPVYNTPEPFLREAVESILNQTFSDFELIVINDASPDENVEKVVLSYHDDRIRYYRNEKNLGISPTRNKLIDLAQGEYLAVMDHDDISLPERFEKQVAFLEQHPEYQLVGTAMQRFNQEGLADIHYTPEKPDRNYMKKTVPFNHATIMTYRYVYEKLGGYTVAPRTVRGQDYDLWFRFYYENFNGYNMQEALYLVREDMNAIKRRTFKVRWSTFQTTCYGFKLLGFPKYLIVKAFFVNLIKSLTPYQVQAWYRNYQKKHNS